MQQRQAAGINHDILMKMIALPDTLTSTHNKALLSMGYDFLRHHSELVALKSSDLTFANDGSLNGMIRKSKADPFGRGWLLFGSDRSEASQEVTAIKTKGIEPVFFTINHGTCKDRTICAHNVDEIYQ